MIPSAAPGYAGSRFPVGIISHAVWLCFGFPLSLRMVDELLAARAVIVSHETARQWAELTEGSAGVASGMVNAGLKFGETFANQTRRKLPAASGTGTRSCCRAPA